MTSTAPHHPPPPSSLVPTITPARLSTLAIYNPSLGPTDETLSDQIVFFTTSRTSAGTAENDKLRQIGLAQGVVEFARGFSQADSCTSVETQKARVITLEIEEPGWWLLAQIELTHTHDPTTKPPVEEYSARELAPTSVLVAQLRRAYRQFRLRYGTFEQCLNNMSRGAFIRRLEKYWHRWAWTRWEVMMKGSPVVDLLGGSGVKMAGGRPGMELGAAERDFLGAWVRNQEGRGMVDMVVSRFGREFWEVEETDDEAGKVAAGVSGGSWFWPAGAKKEPVSAVTKLRQTGVMPTDGCVFQGIGVVRVQSVIDVATFVADLYEHGEAKKPKETRAARRKRRRRKPKMLSHLSTGGGSSTEGSPRNSMSTPPSGHRRNASAVSQASLQSVEPIPQDGNAPGLHTPLTEVSPLPQEGGDPLPVDAAALPTTKSDPAKPAASSYTYSNAKVMNLLTFGWTGRGVTAKSTEATDAGDSPPTTENDSSAEAQGVLDKPDKARQARFLVGFQGDLDLEDLDDDLDNDTGRITSRSIWIAREHDQPDESASDGDDGSNTIEGNDSEDPPLEEYKLVVYTNNPLVFAFVFKSDSKHLTSPSFYRSIHHQLSPLARSVLSASPAKRSLKTISAAVAPRPPFDLIIEDATLSIYSTLPPIPDSGLDVPGWTRTDAVHVYNLMLKILEEKMKDGRLKEESMRSTRGWWVNWVRFKGGNGVVIRRSGEKVDGSDSAGDARAYFEGLVKADRRE